MSWQHTSVFAPPPPLFFPSFSHIKIPLSPRTHTHTTFINLEVVSLYLVSCQMLAHTYSPEPGDRVFTSNSSQLTQSRWSFKAGAKKEKRKILIPQQNYKRYVQITMARNGENQQALSKDHVNVHYVAMTKKITIWENTQPSILIYIILWVLLVFILQ